MSTPADVPPPARFVLELVALPDPHAGHGSPARSAEYRLKLALKDILRGFGLKCVRASPAPPDPVRPPAADAAPARQTLAAHSSEVPVWPASPPTAPAAG